MSFSGKSALVTGAAGGIGGAIVASLRAQGARVAVADRDVTGIEAEARGQAEAIARSIEACLDAPVPFVATIIGEAGGNIVNLRMHRRQSDFFDVDFDVEVKDAKHLTHIAAALRANPSIETVDRAKG